MGDLLRQNGLFHAADDGVSGSPPAPATQHHFGGKNLGTRVHVVFARVLRCGTVGGFKHGDRIGQVGTGSDTDTANLCSQRVGDVVAVEVQRGDHIVLRGAQQNLLQEGV